MFFNNIYLASCMTGIDLPLPNSSVSAVIGSFKQAKSLRELYGAVNIPVEVCQLEKLDVFRQSSSAVAKGEVSMAMSESDIAFALYNVDRSIGPGFREAVYHVVANEQSVEGHWRAQFTGFKTKRDLPAATGVHNDFSSGRQSERQYLLASQAGVHTVPHASTISIFDDYGLSDLLDKPFDEYDFQFFQDVHWVFGIGFPMEESNVSEGMRSVFEKRSQLMIYTKLLCSKRQMCLTS